MSTGCGQLYSFVFRFFLLFSVFVSLAVVVECSLFFRSSISRWGTLFASMQPWEYFSSYFAAIVGGNEQFARMHGTPQCLSKWSHNLRWIAAVFVCCYRRISNRPNDVSVLWQMLISSRTVWPWIKIPPLATKIALSHRLCTPFARYQMCSFGYRLELINYKWKLFSLFTCFVAFSRRVPFAISSILEWHFHGTIVRLLQTFLF